MGGDGATAASEVMAALAPAATVGPAEKRASEVTEEPEEPVVSFRWTAVTVCATRSKPATTATTTTTTGALQIV